MEETRTIHHLEENVMTTTNGIGTGADTVAALIGGPPVVCEPTDRLADLAARMLDDGVGSVAVMQRSRLVGIVTDRDLVQVVAAGGSSGATVVADVMTEQPDTIDEGYSVEDAIDWLNATGYRHLPITRNGSLVGIVSIKDLLWAITER